MENNNQSPNVDFVQRCTHLSQKLLVLEQSYEIIRNSVSAYFSEAFLFLQSKFYKLLLKYFKNWLPA